jgi:hypothetical protein
VRRITLIAAGGVRLTAQLPAGAPSVVRVVRTCDPRDQKERHRHVYFELQADGTYAQVDVLDVPCSTVEIEQ